MIGGSLHKRPGMQKAFPCHEIIMSPKVSKPIVQPYESIMNINHRLAKHIFLISNLACMLTAKHRFGFLVFNNAGGGMQASQEC